MRTIMISTSVFARIWACREPGEETENDILDRMVPGDSDEQESAGQPMNPPNIGGHTERSYGVHFPAGFAISRVYLGREFTANAVNGGWILANNSKTYRSLNELSKAIGAKVENAWTNWFYCDEHGERKPVASRRDPSKVAQRARRPVDVKKMFAELEAIPSSAKK